MKTNYHSIAVILFLLFSTLVSAADHNEFTRKKDDNGDTRNITCSYALEERMRILTALQFCENAPALNPFNPDELLLIVGCTNSSVVHCSGNCGLLTRALHYNLLNGRVAYTVDNTWPPHKPILPFLAEKIIFPDKKFNYTNDAFFKATGLTRKLKELHSSSGRNFFIIEINDSSNKLMFGHNLNAVIYNNSQDDRNAEQVVFFVDAWRTFNKIMTTAQLDATYPYARFEIRLEE